MKKFVKIISVVLCLILVLVSVCACKTTDNGDSTIKATPKPTPENLISQIRLSGYTYFDKAQNLDNFYLAFNKQYPSVDVTVFRDDISTEVYFDALDPIIESGNMDELGDVVLLDTSRMTRLAEKGLLIDLSDYVGEVLNFETYKPINPSTDLLPAAYQACLYNDQLYMSAVEYNHKFVFLNISMLEANGFSFPKDDWTWDDLIAIAEQLVANGIETPIAMDYKDYAVWGAFARSHGADIYEHIGDDTTGKALSLTNPDVVSGLEDLAEIINPERGIVHTINSKDMKAEDISKYAFVIADHEDVARWEEYICSEDCAYSWDYIHFPRWNAEDYAESKVYYQSIGANVYGFAVINHGKSETYNDEFYKACAYLALMTNVTSASVGYCLDGEAVPANKEANQFKFWREYPLEGKNSSVFSNFAEKADYSATLSCFMPVMSEDEINISYAITNYLAGTRSMVMCLQDLQDKAVACWIN